VSETGPEITILFYITDYITKLQLPTHVVYATLEVLEQHQNQQAQWHTQQWPEH